MPTNKKEPKFDPTKPARTRSGEVVVIFNERLLDETKQPIVAAIQDGKNWDVQRFCLDGAFIIGEPSESDLVNVTVEEPRVQDLVDAQHEVDVSAAADLLKDRARQEQTSQQVSDLAVQVDIMAAQLRDVQKRVAPNAAQYNAENGREDILAREKEAERVARVVRCQASLIDGIISRMDTISNRADALFDRLEDIKSFARDLDKIAGLNRDRVDQLEKKHTASAEATDVIFRRLDNTDASYSRLLALKRLPPEVVDGAATILEELNKLDKRGTANAQELSKIRAIVINGENERVSLAEQIGALKHRLDLATARKNDGQDDIFF